MTVNRRARHDIRKMYTELVMRTKGRTYRESITIQKAMAHEYDYSSMDSFAGVMNKYARRNGLPRPWLGISDKPPSSFDVQDPAPIGEGSSDSTTKETPDLGKTAYVLYISDRKATWKTVSKALGYSVKELSEAVEIYRSRNHLISPSEERSRRFSKSFPKRPIKPKRIGSTTPNRPAYAYDAVTSADDLSTPALLKIAKAHGYNTIGAMLSGLSIHATKTGKPITWKAKRAAAVRAENKRAPRPVEVLPPKAPLVSSVDAVSRRYAAKGVQDIKGALIMRPTITKNNQIA